MTNKIIDKFFSKLQRIFFLHVGTKFRTTPFKNLLDKSFEIFEKIGYKFDIVSFNYLKMYKEIIEGEIKMAKASSKDNILVIGCGSLPATTVLIAMKTRANVVSIDIDPYAIEAGAKYIKFFNLENKIMLKTADGINYDVNHFDLIFLLYGLKHQKEILEHLAENMKETTRVVFRAATDLKEEIMKGSSWLSKWFIIKNCIRSNTLPSVDSYLLLKKNS